MFAMLLRLWLLGCCIATTVNGNDSPDGDEAIGVTIHSDGTCTWGFGSNGAGNMGTFTSGLDASTDALNILKQGTDLPGDDTRQEAVWWLWSQMGPQNRLEMKTSYSLDDLPNPQNVLMVEAEGDQDSMQFNFEMEMFSKASTTGKVITKMEVIDVEKVKTDPEGAVLDTVFSEEFEAPFQPSKLFENTYAPCETPCHVALKWTFNYPKLTSNGALTLKLVAMRKRWRICELHAPNGWATTRIPPDATGGELTFPDEDFQTSEIEIFTKCSRLKGNEAAAIIPVCDNTLRKVYVPPIEISDTRLFYLYFKNVKDTNEGNCDGNPIKWYTKGGQEQATVSKNGCEAGPTVNASNFGTPANSNNNGGDNGSTTGSTSSGGDNTANGGDGGNDSANNNAGDDDDSDNDNNSGGSDEISPPAPAVDGAVRGLPGLVVLLFALVVVVVV